MTANILILDDDRFLADSLKRLIESQGFRASTVHTCESAMNHLASSTPDLLVLDLGLPDIDGVSFCRRLRTKYRFPIIMLTARSESIDKVIGLEIGADDYVTKPFEGPELIARIRAHLRRSGEYQGDAQSSQRKEVGPLVIDFDNRDARVQDQRAYLTAKEFDLLAYLAERCGRALSREQLFEHVWGYDIDFNSNSLDVFVYRLRNKLEYIGAPKMLFTVRGFGYKMELPEPAK